MRGLQTMRRVGLAYRQVFTSPAGRILLKDLIRTAVLYRQTGAIDGAEQLLGEVVDE